MERTPRGILHRHAARTRFTLNRLPPAPSLREYVQYYWIVRWDLRGGPPYEQRVLPNLSTHVVFGTASAGVWGPSRSVFTQVLRDRGLALGVRVVPGCCGAVLGLPAGDLRDGPKSLPDVLGNTVRATEEAVCRGGPDSELTSLIDALFTGRVRPLTDSERRVRDTVALIAGDPTLTRVDELASRTGMTVRETQRLFTTHVGTGPKWAIRVYRLCDAEARLSSDSPPGQAELAAELGYSDQAHFARDFASLVGVPPGSYRRQQKVTERAQN
ncbi:AraC family transcriptional regulator [Saccharomonospora glauca]|uniref:DNA-binding domain-containing protein, AraC-type n=1 Tax=Saccharomonospora glauca K62 TaxID=928724 RepID=I1D759_9PSEU|nr:helix-turn-helix domain-containing protein [Saccharomonospora glauca]EIF00784.1 DNA-binding domain-containing protein, AraC-type [Saccharomonospora glauca K62]